MTESELFITKLEAYVPSNEQEEKDKAFIIAFLRNNPDAFLRENPVAHMTASSWITNASRDRVLMVYHNIYNSWSWTGGHCDGDTDTLRVALMEATEETGIADIRPISGEICSVEVLTVDGHEKRGSYVSSHLHLNVTYFLEADDTAPLKIREDENSAVSWFSLDDALGASTEPWFVKRIYTKLNEKLVNI